MARGTVQTRVHACIMSKSDVLVTRMNRDYTAVDHRGSADAKVHKKHIFHTAAAVHCVSAFMQWTGVLGSSMQSSPMTEMLMDIFRIQLSLSKSLLDPAMSAPGQHGRCLQTSKTRSGGCVLQYFAIFCNNNNLWRQIGQWGSPTSSLRRKRALRLGEREGPSWTPQRRLP